MLDELDRRHLSENTIVVYVCDNGWIQQQDDPRYAPKSKQSQYDGGLRTPIMIRWPEKIKPYRDETHPVLSIDIVPTLLNRVGHANVESQPGIDLLDEKAVTSRKAIFGECFTHDFIDMDSPERNLRFRWMIEDGWKLILAQPGEETDVELYNLLDDLHEENNLADEKKQRVEAMCPKLEAFYRVDN